MDVAGVAGQVPVALCGPLLATDAALPHHHQAMGSEVMVAGHGLVGPEGTVRTLGAGDVGGWSSQGRHWAEFQRLLVCECCAHFSSPYIA